MECADSEPERDFRAPYALRGCKGVLFLSLALAICAVHSYNSDCRYLSEARSMTPVASENKMDDPSLTGRTYNYACINFWNILQVRMQLVLQKERGSLAFPSVQRIVILNYVRAPS